MMNRRLLAALLSIFTAVPASAAGPVKEPGAPVEPPRISAPVLPLAAILPGMMSAQPSPEQEQGAIPPAASAAASIKRRVEAGVPFFQENAQQAMPGTMPERFAELEAAFGDKPSESAPSGVERQVEEAVLAIRPAASAKAKVQSGVAKPAELDAKAIAASRRSTQGPIFVVQDGFERPLGYNPLLGIVPVRRALWEYLRHPILRLRQLREYKRRVNEYMAEVTDDDLAWSLQRFPEFEKQEGILRHSNRALVNDWNKWSKGSLMLVTPDDYDEALMSRVSLRKIFKQAMDREEPTISYQATSAHELHDQMHNVAHFMGVTMQERVISVALTGNPPQESVWAAEEKRHGNIMERVYNFSRPHGWPELKEQGIAPTSPSRGARSMITNRALAEIGAGTGYLVLKSNAKKGSPADLALEGIFRDEVYHYVLMDAARRWGLGHASPWYARAGQLLRWSAQMTARAVMDLPGLRRLGVAVEVAPLNQYYGLERLLTIIQHYNDNILPDAVDSVIHERGGFSPLAIFQVAYAFFSIHRRVTKYLATIPDEQGRRAVGKVYGSQAEFDAAVARGEHTRTETFSVEQNPDLTGDEVRELARRFPGRFKAENRSIKASQVRGILARYRDFLRQPGYWLRKKGFVERQPIELDGRPARLLERVVGDDQVRIEAIFPEGGEPRLVVAVRGVRTLEAPFSAVTMRQFGAVFADGDKIKGVDVIEGLVKINEAGPDFTPAEIVARLGAKQTYRAEPLTLIED